MTDLRVCVLGAFDPDYARNYVIREGLARAGVELCTVSIPLKYSTRQRVAAMLRQFPRRGTCDLVFVPAFNQLLAPFVWLRSQAVGLPAAADYLIGLTDALVADRQVTSATKARLFRLFDRFTIARFTTLTDTEAHRQMFQRMLGARVHRMHALPVGVNDQLLDALPPPDPFNAPGPVTLQYVGTFIPFHGVEVILRAAHLLRDDPRCRFELIGAGQTYKPSVQLAGELGLTNVSFIRGYFPLTELLAHEARASILLGVFGDADKTRYVIPNKVYEGMALGRPVITAESPALLEAFAPDAELLTVPPGSPEALAEAITALLHDPARYYSQREAALARIRSDFLPEHIGARLCPILEAAAAS